MDTPTTRSRIEITRVPANRAVATLADDVRRYLLNQPRSLPPKYFYDEHGAWLFEGICSAPEYYPTRAETGLLTEHADTIMAHVAPRHLLELGSGSSRKTVHLLDAAVRSGRPLTYWPFDVTESMVRDTAIDLVDRYPALEIRALVGDYTGGLAGITLPEDGGRRLIVFLGGTIGNFEPDAATRMLADARACVKPGDALLIGMDRIKDVARLEAAYNDAGGYTAAFDRNVLVVLNRELDADFEPEAFTHRAIYNADAARIEMHLVADTAQHITLGALDTGFDIAAGESICTEISRKFTVEGIDALLASGGFETDRHFEADGGDYSLVLARAV